jgi:hypothetical protein
MLGQSLQIHGNLGVFGSEKLFVHGKGALEMALCFLVLLLFFRGTRQTVQGGGYFCVFRPVELLLQGEQSCAQHLCLPRFLPMFVELGQRTQGIGEVGRTCRLAPLADGQRAHQVFLRELEPLSLLVEEPEVRKRNCIVQGLFLEGVLPEGDGSFVVRFRFVHLSQGLVADPDVVDIGG